MTRARLRNPPGDKQNEAARWIRRRGLLRRVHRLRMRCASMIDQDFVGSYDSALKGAGIEFAETRPYQTGDDVRTIDWRVTARAGQPYVKLFRQERQLVIHLLVDISPSTCSAHRERSVHDVLVEVAALLALFATGEGDRIGMTLFSDRIVKSIPPGGGLDHALRLLSELLSVVPTGCETDIASALRWLSRTETRRGVVVLLSDFLCAGFEKALRVTAAQHDVIPVVVADPADLQLPRWGLVRARDPESGRNILIDAFSRRQRHEFRKSAREMHQQLESLFGKLRIPPLQLTTKSDVAVELRRYFNSRGRLR